jgi:hypothetical protein
MMRFLRFSLAALGRGISIAKFGNLPPYRTGRAKHATSFKQLVLSMKHLELTSRPKRARAKAGCGRPENGKEATGASFVSARQNPSDLGAKLRFI